MNLLLVGDLHGEIRLINRYYALLRDDFDVTIGAVLQAGDMGIISGVADWTRLRNDYLQLPTLTYLVHGNHEEKQLIDALQTNRLSIPNLRIAGPKGTLWSHGEATIFALGGAYTPKSAVQTGVIPFSEEAPLAALRHWEWLGRPAVDILLAHEAPTGLGAIGDPLFGNPLTAGSPGMRTLWEVIGPRWYICGHYHRFFRTDEGERRLMILPEAREEAVVLDTETWNIQVFPLDKATVL